MIDKTEYEFIDLLLKNSKFDEKIYNFEIRSLLNDGYIEPNLFEKEDSTFVNLGYFVTPFGKRATVLPSVHHRTFSLLLWGIYLFFPLKNLAYANLLKKALTQLLPILKQSRATL